MHEQVRENPAWDLLATFNDCCFARSFATKDMAEAIRFVRLGNRSLLGPRQLSHGLHCVRACGSQYIMGRSASRHPGGCPNLHGSLGLPNSRVLGLGFGVWCLVHGRVI